MKRLAGVNGSGASVHLTVFGRDWARFVTLLFALVKGGAVAAGAVGGSEGDGAFSPAALDERPGSRTRSSPQFVGTMLSDVRCRDT
jgi:hypothetical protein